jgi:hypothetical protein
MADKEFEVPVLPRLSTAVEIIQDYLNPDRIKFGEIEEIMDEKGTLLVMQCSNGKNPYGLVIGFKRSDFYEKGKTKAVKVEIISRKLQPEYATLLRGRLAGPIIFHE